MIEAPRESVFAGTVNPGVKYLKDETGGRRFWPVKCGRIDIESLKRDRDQLWAEAVVRYRKGSTWWMDSEALNQAAELEQAERYDADPWQLAVSDFAKFRESVSIDEILDAIGKARKDWTPLDKIRISRCLRVLGWGDKQIGPRNNRERRFFPPEPAA